jgi:putative membrane protein
MMGGMWDMMGPGWMAAMMAIQGLIALALVALLVVGVVVGIRWLARSGPGGGAGASSDAALAAARERYARGEISREEFLRLREDLS